MLRTSSCEFRLGFRELYNGGFGGKMLELHEELDRLMDRYPEKERKLVCMEVNATGFKRVRQCARGFGLAFRVSS